ncbi:MAG: hypothetical protein ACF787_09795 [Rhodopirellula sp. JB053]
MIAVFANDESAVISCHPGTPLALVSDLANAIEQSHGTKVMLDITPNYSFCPLSDASTWTLLELTDDSSRIAFSSDVRWDAIPSLVEVIESFGYSRDLRLAHAAELVTMDEPEKWDWRVPHIATRSGEPSRPPEPGLRAFTDGKSTVPAR